MAANVRFTLSATWKLVCSGQGHVFAFRGRLFVVLFFLLRVVIVVLLRSDQRLVVEKKVVLGRSRCMTQELFGAAATAATALSPTVGNRKKASVKLLFLITTQFLLHQKTCLNMLASCANFRLDVFPMLRNFSLNSASSIITRVLALGAAAEYG